MGMSIHSINNGYPKDFPGGPVIKTLPSNAGGAGSITGWGTKSHKALKKPQYKTEAILITDSIKTLNMAHIKK